MMLCALVDAGPAVLVKNVKSLQTEGRTNNGQQTIRKAHLSFVCTVISIDEQNW